MHYEILCAIVKETGAINGLIKAFKLREIIEEVAGSSQQTFAEILSEMVAAGLLQDYQEGDWGLTVAAEHYIQNDFGVAISRDAPSPAIAAIGGEFAYLSLVRTGGDRLQNLEEGCGKAGNGDGVLLPFVELYGTPAGIQRFATQALNGLFAPNMVPTVGERASRPRLLPDTPAYKSFFEADVAATRVYQQREMDAERQQDLAARLLVLQEMINSLAASIDDPLETLKQQLRDVASSCQVELPGMEAKPAPSVDVNALRLVPINRESLAHLPQLAQDMITSQPMMPRRYLYQNIEINCKGDGYAYVAHNQFTDVVAAMDHIDELLVGVGPPSAHPEPASEPAQETLQGTPEAVA
jgi:hypothetical protein